jgi:hypothetical protein
MQHWMISFRRSSEWFMEDILPSRSFGFLPEALAANANAAATRQIAVQRQPTWFVCGNGPTMIETAVIAAPPVSQSALPSNNDRRSPLSLVVVPPALLQCRRKDAPALVPMANTELIGARPQPAEVELELQGRGEFPQGRSASCRRS